MAFALADAGEVLQDGLGAGALGHGRAAEAGADLGGVEVKLGEGAGEGVAVHAEFLRCFALVALVLGEDLKDVTAFELLDGVRVGDAGECIWVTRASSSRFKETSSCSLFGLRCLIRRDGACVL